MGKIKDIIKIYSAALCAAAVIAGASCGTGADKLTHVTFFMGNVKIARAGGEVKPAITMVINDDDVVTTGPASFILMQVDRDIVIRIDENSSVVMKNIVPKVNREVAINNGKVLSKVMKLGKGDSYLVKTPTAVVAVRGTEFSVSYGPGKTVAAVRKGSVEAESAKLEKKETIPEGTTLVITDKTETRKISGPESTELENISNIPLIEGLPGKTEKEIKDLMESLLGKEAMPQGTLGEMKAKYGHIDTVFLYNGRTITGIILSRGAVYTILVPGGVITVPGKQIRNTRVQ